MSACWFVYTLYQAAVIADQLCEVTKMSFIEELTDNGGQYANYLWDPIINRSDYDLIHITHQPIICISIH